MTTIDAAGTTKPIANTKKSKISRCMSLPIKIFVKIRRIFKRAVSECAAQMSVGAFGGEGGLPPHLHYSCPESLPKSYSTSSTASSNNDDDLRHLIRAASADSITTKKMEKGILRRPPVGVNGVGRSQSVTAPPIGRIDEEEPSDFGEDMNLKMEINPRSRNHAVTRRSILREKIINKNVSAPEI